LIFLNIAKLNTLDRLKIATFKFNPGKSWFKSRWDSFNENLFNRRYNKLIKLLKVCVILTVLLAAYFINP